MDEVRAAAPGLYEIWILRDKDAGPEYADTVMDGEQAVADAKDLMRRWKLLAWVIRQADRVRVFPGPGIFLPGCPLGPPRAGAERGKGGERERAPRPPNRRRVGARG